MGFVGRIECRKIVGEVGITSAVGEVTVGDESRSRNTCYRQYRIIAIMQLIFLELEIKLTSVSLLEP